MTSIDQRIVQMKFDKGAFSTGVSDVLSSLEKLKNNLKLKGGADGLKGVGDAAKQVTFDGMTTGLETVSTKFATMATVGITALANVTTKAVDAGLRIAKSLALDPIIDGFNEYELKMGSIQTIMAGTGASLDEVNTYLGDLNTYSDKTIYSFKDMTENIGKFTNAGVKLPTAVKAIQGISNAAALSGANAQDASRAMYNFSQALSAGHVKLIDWKSIENANMATVEFKTQLLDSAVAAGTLTKSADGMYKTIKGTPINATQNFNDSLQEQWMTTEVLTGTLEDYADANTEIGKRAFAAAQDVKTFSQLMDTAKEAVGSGWAQSFEIIFGNFEEAKALWTSVNNALGPLIDNMSDSRNEMLQTWKDMGGRDKLIQGLANVFKTLGNILGPIGKAFADVFKPFDGAKLFGVTSAFLKLTEVFSVSAETGEKVQKVFSGIFSAIKLALTPIKLAAQLIMALVAPLMKIAGIGGGGILSIGAAFGDLITRFQGFVSASTLAAKAIQAVGRFAEAGASKVQAFVAVFENRAIQVWGDQVYPVVQRVAEAVKTFFATFRSDVLPSWAASATSAFTRVQSVVSGFSAKASTAFATFSSALSGAFQSVKSAGGSGLTTAWDAISHAVQKVKDVFGQLGATISKYTPAMQQFGRHFLDTFNTFNADNLLKLVGGGFFAVLMTKLLTFKKSIPNVQSSIVGVVDGITGAFKGLQQSLQAGAILKIAAAILVLAIALGVMAMVPEGRLTVVSVAMSMLVGQLVGIMLMMDKLTSNKAVAKMPLMAISLLLMAAAMAVMASALVKLSEVSAPDLLKALAAMGVMVAFMAAMAAILQKAAPQLIKSASGVVIFAIGMLVLSIALNNTAKAMDQFSSVVEDFGNLDWMVLLKGLLGLAVTLALLAGALSLMPESSAISSVALLITVVALKQMVDVIQQYAAIDTGSIIKGLLVMSVTLGILAGSLAILGTKGGDTLKSAAALLIMGVALKIIGSALQSIGGMSWEAITKALLVLVVALAAMTVAMKFMTTALPGAAAMLIIAVALGMLVPVLMAFGAMKMESIGKALLMLVGVFAAVAVGGLLIAPVVPILIGFGIAVLAVSVSVLVAAAAFSLFAAAMANFGLAGAAGTAAMTAALTSIIALIPALATALALAIVGVLGVLAKASPQIVGSIVIIATELLKGLEALIPPVKSLIGALLQAVIDILVEYTPKVADGAVKILIALLTTIRDNIYQVTDLALDIVVNFVDGIAANLGTVIDAALNLVLSLLNGIADGIRDNAVAFGEAGANIVSAIIGGIIQGVGSFGTTLRDSAAAMASELVAGFKEFLGIHSPSSVFIDTAGEIPNGILQGIGDGIAKVVAKAAELASKVVEGVKSFFTGNSSTSARGLIDGAVNSITGGVSTVVKKGEELARRAVDGVKNFFSGNSSSSASGLISGLGTSISGGVGRVKSAASSLASNAVTAVKDYFSRNSNALGSDLIGGLVKGINDGVGRVTSAARDVASKALAAAKDFLGIASPSKEFAKIGMYSDRGFAEGIASHSGVVSDATAAIGNTALDELRKVMAEIAKRLEADGTLDLVPTITPVLDLSNVKNGADSIKKLFGDEPQVAPSAGAYSAQQASQGFAAAMVGSTTTEAPAEVLNYTQNNYSPKALSRTEIYRQTSNQLSKGRKS